MKQRTSAEIRALFLQFFKAKGHTIEPSVSLVPKDDPTLLWINSGVATLKKYFDGSVVPDNPKIVNAQKAIRTNDIENVGFTARHHTFFEMLGNFSIGDYFKKEAIAFAWEFLTSERWLGFDPERLFVTVHPEDDEAFDLWLKFIQIPEEHIIRLEENFWDIGQGPSGPNTEIFYDRGSAYGDNPDDPELYPGGENERFLEVWNLVFSQFNHNADDTYTPLPQKNIDTGMGLERLVSILQDAETNFDTDLFMPIIKKVEEFAHTKYSKDQACDSAYKIIADHIRTVAFAIGDKAIPSNEGRGYILRRLIRRAVRYAKTLGIEKPFMYKLVPTVGSIMEDYYPEVSNQKNHIMQVIQVEEERFIETLHDGLDRLTTIMNEATKQGKKVISGEDVFKLYDTYGFPKELTDEYVQEYGFDIDDVGFKTEMNKQRERARAARVDNESMHAQSELLTTLKTNSTFVGYQSEKVTTNIAAIIAENELLEKAQTNTFVSIILEETPFYAESGGQIADTGYIYTENASAKVTNVQKAPNGQHIHYVEVEKGQFLNGEKVYASIHSVDRDKITKNHTATHLLHQALRDTFGNHLQQAGSLVTPERLRFDFSHFAAVTSDELKQIEQAVNEKIWENLYVTIEEMSQTEAKDKGAMALFGEKYGDVVRVVEIGDYSIELCGGCHVTNSSSIGLFKIVSESGIGAGVRRIEAVTSKEAFDYLEEKNILLKQVSNMLKSEEDKILTKIESQFDHIKQLEQEKEALAAKLATGQIDELIQNKNVINDVNVIASEVPIKDMNQLRNMMDVLKQKVSSAVILLAAESNGKVLLIAGVSKDLIDRGLHAGNMIREAAKLCGGGGGGRPDMAQAGGKDPSKIKAAVDSASKYVEQQLAN